MLKCAILENIIIYLLVALGCWYFENGWSAFALIFVNTEVRTRKSSPKEASISGKETAND